MPFRFFCSILVFVALAFTAPAEAGMREDCDQSQDLQLKLDACKNMVRATRDDPVTRAWAYVGAGIARAKLGDARRAMKDFNKALKLDPDNAKAYQARGAALHDSGRLREAIADFDRGLQLNPGSADLHYNRGNAYRALDDNRQAIDDFDRAVLLDPDHAQAFNNRGNARADLGSPREASQDYDRAVQLNPDYFEAFLNRGIAHSKLGNYEKAVGDWKETMRIGGMAQARWWQEVLAKAGHYAGPVDGVPSAKLDQALLACARDPRC